MVDLIVLCTPVTGREVPGAGIQQTTSRYGQLSSETRAGNALGFVGLVDSRSRNEHVPFVSITDRQTDKADRLDRNFFASNFYWLSLLRSTMFTVNPMTVTVIKICNIHPGRRNK